MKETDRRVKTAVSQAVSYRNYRRIRDRALRRLGRLYPDQYREFLEEERAKDEAQGKAWLDISGRTISSMGSSSSPNGGSETSIKQTNRDDEEGSDLGGEE